MKKKLDFNEFSKNYLLCVWTFRVHGMQMLNIPILNLRRIVNSEHFGRMKMPSIQHDKL